MRAPILKKTVRDLVKKKTVVFIIILQLFLVLGLGMVLKNIGILFEPRNILVRPLPLGIVGDDGSLQDIMQKERAVTLFIYNDVVSAQQAFDNGVIDGYIHMDETALPHLADIVLPKSDIRASILISILKRYLEIEEDVLRKQYVPTENAVSLSSIQVRRYPEASAARIFEILYAIVVPFFLLLPGILLSSMLIDILVEDMEKKTIPLVLMATTPGRYIVELGIGVMLFAMAQVIVWMLLLALRRVILIHPTKMLLIIMLCTLGFFLLSAMITLAFPHKTKSQLIYSFMLIFLFASLGLTEYHPLRLITSFALDIHTPPMFAILALYGIILACMAIGVSRLSHRMRV